MEKRDFFGKKKLFRKVSLQVVEMLPRKFICTPPLLLLPA
jgi:hypothetical protein